MAYDLLIKNGRVVDGTGELGFIADVAVQDGKIVGVGKSNGAAAERTRRDDSTVIGGEAKGRQEVASGRLAPAVQAQGWMRWRTRPAVARERERSDGDDRERRSAGDRDPSHCGFPTSARTLRSRSRREIAPTAWPTARPSRSMKYVSGTPVRP